MLGRLVCSSSGRDAGLSLISHPRWGAWPGCLLKHQLNRLKLFIGWILPALQHASHQRIRSVARTLSRTCQSTVVLLRSFSVISTAIFLSISSPSSRTALSLLARHRKKQPRPGSRLHPRGFDLQIETTVVIESIQLLSELALRQCASVSMVCYLR